MTPRRLYGDHGQIAPMTVVLVTAILALSGLVLDGGRIFAARREANSVAASAARAGAQAIDVSATRTSGAVLDRQEAAANARRFLDRSGVAGSVTVTDDEVSVTVNEVAHPVVLSLVGMGDQPVTGHGTASIRRGL